MKRIGLLLLLPLILGLAPAPQIDNQGAFLNALRLDLEQLADQEYAGQEPLRPDNWTGNRDIRSPQMASDLWFDTELLANSVFGDGVRPPDWLGITSSSANIIARNTRHDVELAANSVFIDPATNSTYRPEGWQGASTRFTCDRSLQNVIRLADILHNIPLNIGKSTLDYCRTALGAVEDDLFDAFNLTTDPAVPENTLGVRGDLERLADETMGLRNRPANWIGNTDIESFSLAGDAFLDMDSLADELLGENVRPAGWIGVLANNPYVSWRNLRHDLELLADATLGADVRPHGWQRQSELERCSPQVQDLVLLVTDYGFEPDTFESDNYCTDIAAAANQLAENPPVEDVEVVEADSRFMAESESAFSYLDVGATEYMGVMPPGIQFRAWYRNFNESSMMFVSGQDFALFIDRRWTTLPQNVFDTLPTLEGVAPLTFCDANWCNGPAPTPTPTGSGPLELLLAESTVPAPPSLEGQEGPKVQVSWNNVRVTYVSDNANTGTALVALELCTEPTQVNCEPVQNIFDTAVGAAKPVLSQFNGLNVYELPYGYTSGLVIESATLTSPDVWISDPSIR